MTKNYEKLQLNKSDKLKELYSKFQTKDLFELLNSKKSIKRFSAATVLQWRGGDEIFSKCIEIINNSKNFKQRETCFFILGQLNGLTKSQATSIIPMAIKAAENDSSIFVKASSIMALYHIHLDFSLEYDFLLPLLNKMANSSSPNIRLAVAKSLVNSHLSCEIQELLEQLLSDPVEKVRDWAGLAVNMTNCDSKSIRNSLVTMLHDKRKDGRTEAITALAKRHDPRVISALKEELAQRDPLDDAIIAAGELGDPQFIPILEQLLEHFDDSDGLIQSSLDRLKAAQSPVQTHSWSPETRQHGKMESR